MIMINIIMKNDHKKRDTEIKTNKSLLNNKSVTILQKRIVNSMIQVARPRRKESETDGL